MAGKLKKMLIRTLTKAVDASGKTEKKVVFESFKGRHYSDNPRAISEKLHELYPDYGIVWAFRNPETAVKDRVPDYVVPMTIGTAQYRKELASAFAFVRNEAMTEDLVKGKNQIYIQTWHGDRGIKNILYDAWKDGERPTKVMDETLTDLFVLGSSHAEKRAVSAFHYHGEILKSGCPRNDCLVSLKDGDQVRDRIGVRKDQKLLLYAPTLRKPGETLQASVDIEETLRHFGKRGGDWVCLVRAHPKSAGIDIRENGNIIDVSEYPDMSDLMMISDALITDYSSCAGDFILRKKPVILAQFDLEEYNRQERDFYLDLKETGFLIAHDQNELNGYLDDMTDEEYAANCEKILAYFGVCETGHAAEDVCRWIDQKYNERLKG